MTFTLPDDCVPLSTVMAEFERRAPFVAETDAAQEDRGAQDPREAYEANQVEKVVSALEGCGGHLVLISDRHGQQQVAPEILRFVPPSWAHSGALLCFDSRLNDLEAYDQTPIYLPKCFLPNVRIVFPVPSGGRPRHPAYEWYASEGFDRGERTVKELQKHMEEKFGCRPPSPTTLRQWERDGKSKSQSDREND